MFYRITWQLSWPTLTNTDNRYFKKCWYIGLTDISVNRYAIPGANWIPRVSKKYSVIIVVCCRDVCHATPCYRTDPKCRDTRLIWIGTIRIYFLAFHPFFPHVSTPPATAGWPVDPNLVYPSPCILHIFRSVSPPYVSYRPPLAAGECIIDCFKLFRNSVLYLIQ